MAYTNLQTKGEMRVRKLSPRLLLAFIVFIGFGITFVYFASSIGNQSITQFDTSIIGVVQGWEKPWLTTVMKGFTWVGSGFGVTPISMIGFIVLYYVIRRRQQAFFLIITVAGSIILNFVLKHYFIRERPEIHRIMDAKGYSFPSGHAMMAMALYAIIVFFFWHHVKTTGNRIVLVLFAAFMIIIIGTSRIYLGVHYPSDIIGGYAASGLWVMIMIMVYTYFRKPERPVHE